MKNSAQKETAVRGNSDADVKMLAAVRKARHEGEDFHEMLRTVRVVAGVLSLLRGAINENGETSDAVDWFAVESAVSSLEPEVGAIGTALEILAEADIEWSKERILAERAARGTQ